MFLTITIDTKRKPAKKVSFNKSNLNVASGWRKKLHMKKRSLWTRIKNFHKPRVAGHALEIQESIF